MKIGLTIFLVLLMSLTTSLMADIEEGSRVYKQSLRTLCGFSGDVMAKKHTQEEWKKIFETKQLSQELRHFCPHVDKIEEQTLEHLYEFLYNYASDSGNQALCY